jgi:hypothetical protein
VDRKRRCCRVCCTGSRFSLTNNLFALPIGQLLSEDPGRRYPEFGRSLNAGGGGGAMGDLCSASLFTAPELSYRTCVRWCRMIKRTLK